MFEENVTTKLKEHELKIRNRTEIQSIMPEEVNESSLTTTMNAFEPQIEHDYMPLKVTTVSLGGGLRQS